MTLLRPILPPRFKILRRIGEGGMGVVYEAQDLERDQRVALKSVLHDDADSLARFKHEFRALQDIHHPNLVSLGELVANGGDLFFTMELVDGVDLVTFVRGERRAIDAAATTRMPEAREPANPTLPDPPRSGVSTRPPLPRSAPPPSSIAAFDEARLRDAFRQVALGLAALHKANKIHRDVKPSNVLVTPAGRVVLLDFGLVVETNSSAAVEQSMMAGTPGYMAPEQVTGESVGAEADWYAMGVMMHQCLTGRRPFEGSTMKVLQAKIERDPPPPSAHVTGIPHDLDVLCAQLLSVDKKSRPSTHEVLTRLHGDGGTDPNVSQPGTVPFVGRQRELIDLARAFSDVVSGQAVTVALQGESGVGKSCLVRRFVDDVLTKKGGDLLVLSGRCYEREAVPYKAFDEIIDTLSRNLAQLENAEILTLLPSHVEDLALLFPALLRVELIAQHVRTSVLDPHERRRHAFDAVRELFTRLARRHRLVLAIDDLQWTDADSLALLADLLRSPNAPPMLLVATVRKVADAAGGRANVLASLPGDVRVLDLDRLAPQDARELATRLLKGVREGVDAAAIAEEAGGHPLFIDELVRHAVLTSGEHPAAALRLDDALAARVELLDPSARRVLELACVFGAPTSQETLAHAAALDMREFVRTVSLLRTSNLVRTRGARVSDAIEPYHDRVREALIARMDPEVRRSRHESLASALEVSRAFDPEVLATHWTGAGQPARAAKYSIVAAEQAVVALAFDRAARLYEEAIALLPVNDPRRDALRRQLGDALANAGQGVRAADEYERAATVSSAADALELRRRAAAQLLRSGEMARGMAASRRVLAAVGMRFARTTLEAVISFIWYRCMLRMRGLDFVARDESEIAAEELMRVDVCGSVADTAPYADTLRGAIFHVRHLLLALRLGEPKRIARALAIECSYLGASGSKKWARTQRTIARARDVSERAGTPEARARMLAYEGAAYCFNLRYVSSIERLEGSIALYREVPGSAWEITISRFFLFVAYHYACRFVEQRVEQEAALKDALARGDTYAAVMFRIGVLNRIWWAAGDPERARRELDAAVRDWRAGSGGYDLVHFHQLVGYAYIDLYEGKAAVAHARVLKEWPALRRSLFLQVEPLALEAQALRARAALGVAADPRCKNRKALIREAEHALRGFKAIETATNRWAMLSIRTGIAALEGRNDEVMRLLDHISKDDTEEGWLAHHLALWVLGARRGGIEGVAQVRRAKDALAARGIAPDERMMTVIFPGLGAIE